MAGKGSGRVLTRVRKRTWVIIGASTALVAAGGITGAILLNGSGDEAQAEPQTRTAEASLATFTTSLESSGTLTPAVQKAVSFEASGTVQTIDIEAGDTVTKGQKLATIDTLTVNANLLQAKADLAEVVASLSSAQTDSSGSDADVAKIAALEADVTLAQESVAEAEEAVAATTLSSPVAGIVTAVSIEVGDTVSSGSSSSSSQSSSASGATSSSPSTGASGSTGATGSTSSTTTTSAFTIVGTDSWTVDVSLGETEIGEVEEGDTVELVTDDDVQLTGEVTEVGKLPSTTSGSAAYTVSIDVATDDDTTGVYDGTSVTATIITDSRDDVLSVPSAAVTTDQEGTSTVTLVDGDGAETEQKVTLGETSGELVEITEGLSEGDTVLITVFTPGAAGSDSGEGTNQQGEMPGGGQMPGGGEMPTGEMPSGQMPGGQMPGGESQGGDQ